MSSSPLLERDDLAALVETGVIGDSQKSASFVTRGALKFARSAHLRTPSPHEVQWNRRREVIRTRKCPRIRWRQRATSPIPQPGQSMLDQPAEHDSAPKHRTYPLCQRGLSKVRRTCSTIPAATVFATTLAADRDRAHRVRRSQRRLPAPHPQHQCRERRRRDQGQEA